MTKKQKIILILGMFLAVPLFAFVVYSLLVPSVQRSEDKKPVNIYFVNAAGNRLEFETRYIEKGEMVDEVTGILVELIQGPASSNLRRTLPGYRGGSNEYNFLQGIKTATRPESDDTCIVEIFFSEEYFSLSPAEELILRGSLVYSFTELDFVEGVKIYVADEEIKRDNTQLIGTMTRENVYINTVLSAERTYQTVSLYFPNEAMTYLVKEEREVEVTNRSIERIIVEELIKGPHTPGLVAVIPSDTQINDVTIYERICYLDLNAAFMQRLPADTNASVLAVYSIVNSITEISETNVRRVQFYIDAQLDEGIGNRINLSHPFERNEDIIQN